MNNFFHNNLDTFTSLLEYLNEGVIIYRDDTKIVYANRAASQILGVANEMLLGKTADQLEWYFVDENLDRLDIEAYPANKVFASNANLDDELIGLHLPCGALRWIEINGTIVTDAHGDRTAMMVFGDVTERKNAFEEAELFKKAIEAIDVGITLADPNLPDTPLIYANPSFLDKTGYSKEEVIGRNCRFLQGDSRNQSARSTIRNAIQEHRSTQTELVNYTKSGDLFYNLLTLSPIYLHNQLRYFVGVQHDITAIKLQEEKLKEQAHYIQTIIDAQEDIIIATNGLKIVYANKALLNFFGYSTFEPFIEESTCICNRFIPDEHFFHLGKVAPDELWVNTLIRLDEKHRIVIMESGEEITHYFKATVIPFNESHYIVSFHDVSATLLKEEILISKAYHDPLTQAYNRQYFHEYIAKWRRKNTKYNTMGFILLDLDNFKSINDTYGHLKGDEVLISTANTINSVTRTNDPVVRWGGEEFIVLLELESSDALFRIAETIRASIAKAPIDQVGFVTSSVGITLMEKSESLESALKRADDALYRAKKSGKNRVEINLAS